MASSNKRGAPTVGAVERVRARRRRRRRRGAGRARLSERGVRKASVRQRQAVVAILLEQVAVAHNGLSFVTAARRTRVRKEDLPVTVVGFIARGTTR